MPLIEHDSDKVYIHIMSTVTTSVLWVCDKRVRSLDQTSGYLFEPLIQHHLQDNPITQTYSRVGI